MTKLQQIMVRFLLISFLIPAMWKICVADDDQSLDPRGRNVCLFPKRRPYLNDALMPREWRTELEEDDMFEYRCCDGWSQRGNSCSEAVCNTPCVHGSCAAPNYCLCNEHWTGPTCNKTCPANSEDGRCVVECDCPSGQCHYPDGACSCPVGFTGPNCTMPCIAGYFGPDCLLQCRCSDQVTCAPDNGSCIAPQNISTLPDAPQVQVHALRMATLTGCGITSIVAILSATVYAVKKRRKRRVSNVRKRTLSMTPITRERTTNEEIPIISTRTTRFQGSKYPGEPSKLPLCCSSSYVGMCDLLAVRDKPKPSAVSRSMSCLSTSTTVSMVQSISDSRDTIYEVNEAHVLAAYRNKRDSGPCYTNSEVFAVEPKREVVQIHNCDRDEGCSTGSDTDEEYNYPYADLATLRRPMTMDSRPLRPTSSQTEYVVVLKQDHNSASYTLPQPWEGMVRERPSGMSFSEVSASSSTSPEPYQGLTTKVHYHVPRTPPIKRFEEAPSNEAPGEEVQRCVRGYMTSVRRPSSLTRGSEWRRARRIKTEILQCPPPPPYEPPSEDNAPPRYINERITTGIAPQRVSCPSRKAPPIPKPRTRPMAGARRACPDKTQDAEARTSSKGEEVLI